MWCFALNRRRNAFEARDAGMGTGHYHWLGGVNVDIAVDFAAHVRLDDEGPAALKKGEAGKLLAKKRERNSSSSAFFCCL